MRYPAALRTNLWKELATPFFTDFDKFFDQKVRSFTDVEETKTHYMLNMDMPGVTKEDIKLEIKDGTLMITGERKVKKDGEEQSYFYQNSFYLGDRVDTKGVDAKFENGVLKVSIPKSEESKPQLIAVK